MSELPEAGPWHRRDTDAIPTRYRHANPEPLDGDFVGDRGRVFGLAVRTGILTVLTLGIYRFWMKTRLRRFYWSAVRFGGVPAEYLGDPLEKLLGFLFAVVILAFYIGVVNLVLMFLSFSLFQDNFAAYLLSFVGVVPLWFYARYRARRYVLARTRWRGIRFGLEPGAWGYAWRAIGYWFLTIISAGLLWPLMTFQLEKYRTNRTWYGDCQLTQEGRWTLLFPALRHVLLAVLIAVGSVFVGLNGTPLAFGVTALCVPWFAYGLAYYRAKSFERLTNGKRAGDVVFLSKPRPMRVFGIYGFGLALSGFVASFFLVPLGLALVAVLGAMLGFEDEAAMSFDLMTSGSLTVIGILSYFTFFLSWAALTHTFVTLPLWAHFTETLTVVDPGSLEAIRQRPRDEFDEAEGFAEALDVGAGI
ncbi:MAG: YjgN family protein [Pseudopelagicola sp.]|nr:YjgN family protein [Pseudopelagicola sp.]